jgi:hypothetical protein
MIVVICPTTQEEMCTTGSLRMAGMRITRLSPRHCERKRSNPECIRGTSLDCFVALLLAMTMERIRTMGKGAQATCPPSSSEHAEKRWARRVALLPTVRSLTMTGPLSTAMTQMTSGS